MPSSNDIPPTDKKIVAFMEADSDSPEQTLSWVRITCLNQFGNIQPSSDFIQEANEFGYAGLVLDEAGLL